MNLKRIRRTYLLAVAATVALGLGALIGPANEPVLAYEPGVAVGEKIQGENACYVRLPDLPAPRYGGMGAYNEDTGVLVYVGGAKKLSVGNDNNTQAQHDMYAIKLDGSMDEWNRIPYSPRDGYNIGLDRGCREMTNIKAANHLWASVLGKDGCAGGDSKNGDIKHVHVGTDATRDQVYFVPGVGVATAPDRLLSNGAKLARFFGTMDTKRGRAILGQGTFNTDFEQESQDEVYQGILRGGSWNVTQIFPKGPIPSRRFGSCAAYVHNEDDGLDGVLVMGGNSGGRDATTYSEVWWLDFSKTSQGEWSNITDRFTNQDDFGGRRSGGCTYDVDSRTFYSWFGRASSSIPDGDSRSAGAWRVDLTTLADPAAPLTWQRLAKDKQTEIRGRRLIPHLWDTPNKRMFVVGGRYKLESHKDVWAIYPDVTGQACTDLDPMEPHRQPPVTPEPLPTQRPADTPLACDHLTGRVPDAAIQAALASPGSYSGWNQPCKVGQPISRYNGQRTNLGLRNPNLPYNPIYNGLVYKCGCP